MNRLWTNYCKILKVKECLTDKLPKRIIIYPNSLFDGIGKLSDQHGICNKHFLLINSFHLMIVTPHRNGRDSLRDLYGFLFTVDNSIAIYEYKQIGKKR